MSNQNRFSHSRKKWILIGAATLAAVLVVAGGFMSYAVYRGGQYIDVDHGYILKRLDARDTYVVKLPTAVSVPDSDGGKARSSDPIAAQPVTLTYDHSEKGRNHNWDIYTDERGTRYTYHEETGQMVSIEFRNDHSEAKTANSVCRSEEDIRTFAEQYLRALVPKFDLYGLASTFYSRETPDDPDGRYQFSYGVQVGEYFSSARISLSCQSTGELTSINFPQTTVYEDMTSREKEQIAEKLPSREVLEQYAREQMEEKYGDRLVSMEITNIYLGKEGTTYDLLIGLDVTAYIAKNAPAGFSESVTYPIK